MLAYPKVRVNTFPLLVVLFSLLVRFSEQQSSVSGMSIPTARYLAGLKVPHLPRRAPKHYASTIFAEFQKTW